MTKTTAIILSATAALSLTACGGGGGGTTATTSNAPSAVQNKSVSSKSVTVSDLKTAANVVPQSSTGTTVPMRTLVVASSTVFPERDLAGNAKPVAHPTRIEQAVPTPKVGAPIYGSAGEVVGTVEKLGNGEYGVKPLIAPTPGSGTQEIPTVFPKKDLAGNAQPVVHPNPIEQAVPTIESGAYAGLSADKAAKLEASKPTPSEQGTPTLQTAPKLDVTPMYVMTPAKENAVPAKSEPNTVNGVKQEIPTLLSSKFEDKTKYIAIDNNKPKSPSVAEKSCKTEGYALATLDEAKAISNSLPEGIKYWGALVNSRQIIVSHGGVNTDSANSVHDLSLLCVKANIETSSNDAEYIVSTINDESGATLKIIKTDLNGEPVTEFGIDGEGVTTEAVDNGAVMSVEIDGEDLVITTGDETELRYNTVTGEQE